MSWLGEGVLDAVVGQQKLEVVGLEDLAAVAEDAGRGAGFLKDALEDPDDFGRIGPADAFEGHQPAAVVIDDAENPDVEEAENAGEGGGSVARGRHSRQRLRHVPWLTAPGCRRTPTSPGAPEHRSDAS